MDDESYNKRVQEIEEEEKRMLREYGWYVHFVFETDKGEMNGLANIHTHGLAEKFDHPDLQIVLPISPKTAHPLLVHVVEQIKSGKKYEGGTIATDILQGLEVFILSFEESGRTVLRLLIPDPNGNLPTSDNCDPLYKRQMEILPD